MEAGRLDQADRALEDAGRIAMATSDVRLAAHARVQRLQLGLQVDIGQAAAEVGEVLPELLATFERDGDEVGLCQAWRLRAFVFWTQASSAAAEDALGETAGISPSVDLFTSVEDNVITTALKADKRWRMRAFNWTSRERFPSASTVGRNLGERLRAQRFPGFC
jgi:hypothetical protein